MHKFDLYPAICPACASVAADEILTKNLNSIFIQKFAETSKSWLSIWASWNWIDHYFGFWDLKAYLKFRHFQPIRTHLVAGLWWCIVIIGLK